MDSQTDNHSDTHTDTLADSDPQLSWPARGVAWIEFSRPAQANRLDDGDIRELLKHLDEIESRADITVLVLTGRGTVFSAGYDLRALGRSAAAGNLAFETLADRLEAFPGVTIAAINGPAMGGASDLALACDLRLGTTALQVQVPACRIGLPLYAGALKRWSVRMGLSCAMEVLLGGARLDAATLAARGFVHALVAPESLRETALRRAIEIAGWPAAPLVAMKQVMLGLGAQVSAADRERLAAALDPQEVAQRVATLRPPKAPQA
jgi:enoyl-CoA hydratase/carnithine racemase